jgi:hypothetical protein
MSGRAKIPLLVMFSVTKKEMAKENKSKLRGPRIEGESFQKKTQFFGACRLRMVAPRERCGRLRGRIDKLDNAIADWWRTLLALHLRNHFVEDSKPRSMSEG